MAGRSAIEWTHATWNPVTGCDEVSPGCDHCYAARLAKRLQAMGNPRYANGFAVTLHPDLLDLPLRWRAPRRVFVNSMSDLSVGLGRASSTLRDASPQLSPHARRVVCARRVLRTAMSATPVGAGAR